VEILGHTSLAEGFMRTFIGGECAILPRHAKHLFLAAVLERGFRQETAAGGRNLRNAPGQATTDCKIAQARRFEDLPRDQCGCVDAQFRNRGGWCDGDAFHSCVPLLARIGAKE